MEEQLKNLVEEMLITDNVTGCVMSDHRGLCLLHSQSVNPESAGLVFAIAQHAARIDPENTDPVICLENNNRQCLILKDGLVTTGLFKDKTLKNGLANM